VDYALFEPYTRLQYCYKEMEPEATTVLQVLKEINRCWLEGRPEDIGRYFHEDIVVLLPGFSGKARGRSAVVQSFVDFCSNAQVHEYSESDHDLDVIGDQAIAGYSFRITYSLTGKKYEGTGRDIWSFTRHEGRWLAAWRFMTDLVEKEV